MRIVRRTILFVSIVAIFYASFGGQEAQTQAGGIFGTDIFFSVRQLPLNGFTYGGPIQSIARNPANPFEVLAASQSGGLFKSVDGGNNWRHVDSLTPSDLNVV